MGSKVSVLVRSEAFRASSGGVGQPSPTSWDVRPCSPVRDPHTVTIMHVVTATDEALCEVIEDWLRLEIPGDGALVSQIAHRAMLMRADGATLEETCEWTRILARSWFRHPSHGGARRHLSVVGASGTS